MIGWMYNSRDDHTGRHCESAPALVAVSEITTSGFALLVMTDERFSDNFALPVMTCGRIEIVTSC